MLKLVNKASNYYHFKTKKFGPTIGQFSFVDDKANNSLRIISFCIFKNYRGKGYGQQMLREAIDEAKRIHNNRSLTLNVEANNDVAIRIYQKHGFQIVGMQNSAYQMIYQPQDTTKLKLQGIKCLEVRQFYDSKWLLKFTNGSECIVTRYDTDEISDFIKHIEKCQTIEDVKKKVDLRNSILYD